MTTDIIVLIPGIGGSRLERDGKVVYDLTLRTLPRLIWNWVGGELAFAGGSGKPDDGVVATELFNNQLIPGFFGIDDYDGLCATLKAAVQVPDRQFFKFPYDWRASNCWAAKALEAFILPKLHDWRNGPGGPDAKLWLVCHSMGGLVARYFLEHLGGAEVTRHMVSIGVPHRGAPKALNALVNGLGLGPLDFSRVVRSFASTYELLPQYPVIQVGESTETAIVRIAEFLGLGSILPSPTASDAPTRMPSGLSQLPHIDKTRLQDALEFHAAIRRPVIRRIASGEPAPYKLSCVFNRRQSTPQLARWSTQTLTMSDDFPASTSIGATAGFQGGDGTVPGVCAVPIEWSDTVDAIAVNEKHVSLPSAAAVTDIIFNLAHPLDTRAYMGNASLDGTIGLTVESLVRAGEVFEVTVDVIKAAQLTVTIRPVDSPTAILVKHVRVRELSCARVECVLREPGSYLVSAKSVDPLRPIVSDWVIAISAP